MSLLLEALKQAERKKQLLEQEKIQQNRDPLAVDQSVNTNSNSVEQPILLAETKNLKIETIKTKSNTLEQSDPLDWQDKNENSNGSVNEGMDLGESFIDMDLDINPDLLDHIKTDVNDSALSDTVIAAEKNNSLAENTESKNPASKKPALENPASEKPVSKKPALENPASENPVVENKQQHRADLTVNNPDKRPIDALNQRIKQLNIQYKKKRFISIALIIVIAITLVLVMAYYFYLELLNIQDLSPPDITENVTQNPTDPILENSSESLPKNDQQEKIEQHPAVKQLIEKKPATEQTEELTLEQTLNAIVEQTVEPTVENKPAVLQQVKQTAENKQTIERPLKQTPVKPESYVNVDIETQESVIETKEFEDQTDQLEAYDEIYGQTSNLFKISKRKITNQTLLLTQQAYQKYQQGKFKKAQQLYQQVLTIKADYKDALLGLAAIAIQQNDVSKAKKFYYQILHSYPGEHTAILALNQLNQTIEPLKAEQLLKNKVQNDPANVFFQASMGNFYASRERWKLAQQHYFNAYTLDRNNISYNYNLAVSLDNLGKISQATIYYEKALSLSHQGGRVSPLDPELIIKRLSQLSPLKR